MKFSTFLFASSTLVVLDSGFVRGQFRGTTTARQPNEPRILGGGMGSMDSKKSMKKNTKSCDTYDETKCLEKEMKCVYDATGDGVCSTRPCDTYNEMECEEEEKKCFYDTENQVCVKKSCDVYDQEKCLEEEKKCFYDIVNGCRTKSSCDNYNEDKCERKEKECVYDTDVCSPRPCDTYDREKDCKKNKKRCVWDGDECSPKEE